TPPRSPPFPSTTLFRSNRTQQPLGFPAQLRFRFHQLDAAGLAAPASVNLRLDHQRRPAELVGRLQRVRYRKGSASARHRDTKFRSEEHTSELQSRSDLV